MTAFQRRNFGKMDRGTRRGAKRVIVTPDLQVIDHALAKQHGIEGIYFQSKAEGLRYVGLVVMARAGVIRHLERQIRFPLHAVRPDGLKEKLGTWGADFVYEERVAVGPDDPAFAETGPWRWIEVIEDVKGNPEDLYKWKRLHFQAEYGKTITETKAWSRR